MSCLSSASPGSAAGGEAQFWEQAAARWQPLFGGFFTQGVSIEWHDFQLDKDLDWALSFHPESLEVCLNFSGSAVWSEGGEERKLSPGELAVYTSEGAPSRAVRKAGTLHRFLTLEFSASFLKTHYASCLPALKPAWRGFAQGSRAARYLEIASMSTPLLALRQGMLAPPVSPAARESWYLAKTMEVLSHVAFGTEDGTEFFCQRHQRQNRERVDRARYFLERDLENPPSLDMLAQEVGCSPFHLSRLFAEQMGMSIPKFLRTRRIELAAEYLRSGRMNVTQAAMAVGYSSLSAFNKAFVEQMGCCPGLYPAVSVKGRKK